MALNIPNVEGNGFDAMMQAQTQQQNIFNQLIANRRINALLPGELRDQLDNHIKAQDAHVLAPHTVKLTDAQAANLFADANSTNQLLPGRMTEQADAHLLAPLTRDYTKGQTVKLGDEHEEALRKIVNDKYWDGRSSGLSDAEAYAAAHQGTKDTLAAIAQSPVVQAPVQVSQAQTPVQDANSIPSYQKPALNQMLSNLTQGQAPGNGLNSPIQGVSGFANTPASTIPPNAPIANFQQTPVSASLYPALAQKMAQAQVTNNQVPSNVQDASNATAPAQSMLAMPDNAAPSSRISAMGLNQGEVMTSKGNPANYDLDAKAGQTYRGREIPKVEEKIENGVLLRKYPSGRETAQEIPVSKTLALMKAFATEDAKSVGKLDEQTQTLQGVNYDLDKLDTVVNHPEWQKIHSNAFLNSSSIGNRAQLTATRYFKGTPQQKELVGEFDAISGDVVTKVASQFKGAFKESIDSTINSMKPVAGDSIPIQKAKIKAIKEVNKIAIDINTLTGSLTRSGVDFSQAYSLAAQQLSAKRQIEAVSNNVKKAESSKPDDIVTVQLPNNGGTKKFPRAAAENLIKLYPDHSILD